MDLIGGKERRLGYRRFTRLAVGTYRKQIKNYTDSFRKDSARRFGQESKGKVLITYFGSGPQKKCMVKK